MVGRLNTNCHEQVPVKQQKGYRSGKNLSQGCGLRANPLRLYIGKKVGKKTLVFFPERDRSSRRRELHSRLAGAGAPRNCASGADIKHMFFYTYVLKSKKDNKL